MENETIRPSEEQVEVFAKRFHVDLSDASQRDGVIGSVVDLLNGRGTLPEWMKDEPCFAELVASRGPKAEPEAVPEAPAVETEV